ncbi:MAG: LapA family protein [Halioglobus sp.]|nr:LapA family protein [Halioglobus sp.]
MKFLRHILTVLVAFAMVGVGVLFALQNEAPVALDLLVYNFEPKSLALWVLSAFAIGGIVGLLVSSAMLLRMRASLRTSRRQLEKTRAELSELRAEGPVAGTS